MSDKKAAADSFGVRVKSYQISQFFTSSRFMRRISLKARPAGLGVVLIALGLSATASVAVVPATSTVFLETQKLIASDAAPSKIFGRSVAVSGDRMIAGSDDDLYGLGTGAAYIHEVQDRAWVEVAKLTAADVVPYAYFGTSVDIDGDYAIVGAPGDDPNSSWTYSGSAYLFERQADGQWLSKAKLYDAAGQPGDNFGFSVSLSGDTAVVGAYGYDDGANYDAGAVYVYERDANGTWGLVHKEVGSGVINFGSTVVAAGDRFAVGSDRSGLMPEPAPVGVYERGTGGAWARVASLLQPVDDDNPLSGFGDTLGFFEDRIIVGTRASRAYIYERQTDGRWPLAARLDPPLGTHYGGAVGVSGARAIVGGYRDSNQIRSVFVFARQSDGAWILDAQLIASDPAPGERFGSNVDISGADVIVGVPEKADLGSGTGAVYAYELPVSARFFALGDLGGAWFKSAAFGVSADGSVVVGDTFETGGTTSQAFRWTEGEGMVSLGVAPGGYYGSTAIAVSDDNRAIIGSTTGPREYGNQLFRWTEQTGMVVLGSLPGYREAFPSTMSADGSVVVGWSEEAFTGRQVFRWTESGGMVGLGFLTGGDSSVGGDVSADGSVIVGGSRSAAASGYEAFRWTQAGGMVGLGLLPGGISSRAWHVSADGSIVAGNGTDAPTVYSGQAFRWTQAGGMVGLGYLPGADQSYLIDMSADGRVLVGHSGSQAFRWTETEGMVGLGILPGHEGSQANLVSADGSVIAGYSYSSASGRRYFIWTARDGMRALKDLLLQDHGIDVNDWGALESRALSYDGDTLVGFGTNPQGSQEAWVVRLNIGPVVVDADNDGMSDAWEILYGLDPNDPLDAALDLDGDGLMNLQEYQAGADPTDFDTDDDSLSDYEEVTLGLDPANPDSDGDGMPDNFEYWNNLDALDPADAALDPDVDGLTNLEEFQAGTSVAISDTDRDGLTDGDEVKLYKTKPGHADTDSDELSDGDEVLSHGTDPLVADTDTDVMPDGWEVLYGLNPLDATDAALDRDNDGFSNLQEYEAGADPADPEHYPGSPGTLKWSFTAVGAVASVAIAGDGTIYAGSTDGNVYAFNPDGSLKLSLASGTSAAPVIAADGTVYVMSYSTLRVFSPEGLLKWSYQVEGYDSVRYTPAIASDGTVYIGAGGRVIALDAQGTVTWTATIGGFEVSSPAIAADGTVYARTWENELYALAPDGTVKWVYPLGSRSSRAEAAPAIGADGTIYIATNDTSDYRFLAINPDGTLKWSAPRYWWTSSATIATDGTIYLNGGSLVALNPDGSQKWSYVTNGPTYATPVIGKDGTIYAGGSESKYTSNGWVRVPHVYAFNSDGSVKWIYKAASDNGETSKYAAIGTDGTVYFGSMSIYDNSFGKLYAVHSGSGGLADAPWPMYGHDARRTGNVQTVINHVPGITLLSPSQGAQFNLGDAVVLEATASDAEDGDLSAGIQWSSDVDGVLGTGSQLTVSLPAGNHVITAEVTDSHGKVASDSVTVSVNAPPTVTLASPADGAIVTEGDSILLQASASDAEEGELSPSILWYSDVSGLLGAGSQLTVTLSLGSHVITARVTDSGGLTGSASAGVLINRPPQLSVLSPAAGSHYMADETVTLQASATDLEDGDIGPSIQWTSNVDGALGSGTRLSKTLSAGAQVLTVTVTDSAAAAATVSVAFEVEPLPVITLSADTSAPGKNKATLNWAGARTTVDIYQNGVVIATAPGSGTQTFKYKGQTTFKVCETNAHYCSPEVTIY